jgi:hypothetical protein
MKAATRLAATRLTPITLAATAALAVLPPAPISAANRAKAASGATITRSVHIAFENCNAQHITLTVTAPTHSFTPAQPVIVRVQLRNSGSSPCGAAPAGSVPQAHHALTVGPCGPLSLTVRTARGVAVYPGPVVFHCPEETGFELAPHGTARASASWNQVAYPASSASQVKAPPLEQAPPGSYRITVGGAVTVPIRLADPSS